MIVKIKFVDFWPGFNPKTNYFTDILGEICEFCLSDTPDLLFFSCYGNQHLQYRCHKIFYASENIRPRLRTCDYSVGFDHLNDARHFRLPLYLLYGDPLKLIGKPPLQTRPEDKRFCCFVVSNGNARERIAFFEKLSARRPVDSGGRLLNNIGGPVSNKRAFIRQYRFTIAFENSSFPGYTTEKILEPMLEGSIPIYWGNPNIREEFNPKSFINLHDYESFDEAIEEIIKIDADPERYARMLQEPWFKDDRLPPEISRQLIVDWFGDVLGRFAQKKAISATPMFYWNRIEDKLRQALYWSSVLIGTVKNFR